MAAGDLLLGCVFDPPEDAVTRLLVTRHWPRGVARASVDQWEPQLGPADALSDALADGSMSRDAFEAAYRTQIFARPSLLDWAARMVTNNGVVLLGEAAEDAECHRGVLAAVLRERIG